MTTETALESGSLRQQAHPNCIVCSPKSEAGLHLVFTTMTDGSVETRFDCDRAYEGFPGLLHGGIITSLLDGTMTNCLFAHGRMGLTGELRVRFRSPVATGRSVQIRAWIETSSPPFYAVKAELLQDQQVKATAAGKFMGQAASQFGCRQPDRLSPEGHQDADL